MKIVLKRHASANGCTIGSLSIDGIFECFTLEDIERITKVDGKTAISKGTYKVGVSMSNRFKKMLPILFDVPNFSGVRIHAGNTAADTEGCILVGTNFTGSSVTNSKIAFTKFYAKLNKAIEDNKNVTLTIE